MGRGQARQGGGDEQFYAASCLFDGHSHGYAAGDHDAVWSATAGTEDSVWIIGAVLLLSFFYQFAAYQQKYAQLYYENALIVTLKTTPPPAPGFVYISSERKETPKYLRDIASASNWHFLEAYGKKLWGAAACTDGHNCDLPSSYRNGTLKYAVDRELVSVSDLRVTRMNYSVENFDPFGNPLYYGYYFLKDYERLHPQLELVSVSKF